MKPKDLRTLVEACFYITYAGSDLSSSIGTTLRAASGGILLLPQFTNSSYLLPRTFAATVWGVSAFERITHALTTPNKEEFILGCAEAGLSLANYLLAKADYN